MNDAPILLTGATGFVGRQVLKCLMGEGRRVRVVIRAGSEDKLDKRELLREIVLTSDLFAESTKWWEKVCQGVDTIIHVAWCAEPGVYLTSPKNLDCLYGTLRLARGAINARVGRFIGIGTCFEYDLRYRVLDVGTPLRPTTPYAGAKAAAYLALSQTLPPQGVTFAWCRLFYLYGEGEDPRRLVRHLHDRLKNGEVAELTSGGQIRDFIDVAEAGRMITDVALGNFEGATNICSGVPITVRQLAEQIADTYGRRDLLKFGARADNAVDPFCVVGVRGSRQILQL